jgi:membrane fusion protein (multidrug efflux system)
VIRPNDARALPEGETQGLPGERPALPMPSEDPQPEAFGRSEAVEAFGKPDSDHAKEPQDPKDDANKKPPLYKRKGFLIGAAIVVLLGIIVAVAFYIHSRHWQSTDDALTDGHVVDVSSKVSGRIRAVLVDDNQDVKAGQTLIELDPRDYEAARAQQAAALSVAQAEAARANAELARYQRVAQNGGNAVSPQDIDEVVANARKANAQVTQAQANLEAAELSLSYTKIVAPFAGRIARKQVEPGAYVSPGQQLVTLVDPHVWVTANFKETQVTYMDPGDPVEIEIDAFPSLHLRGHVDSLQPGSGARFSLLPPENATGNFVKVVQRVPVKIVLDNYDPATGPYLGVGLSVVPKVHIR